METLEIKNQFKKSGIKPSEKKVKLFSEIVEKKSSFDALTLYESMKNEMDRATVYRTLTQFKEKNLIRETTNIDGKQFYENNAVKNHPHFICNICKTVECLEEVPLNLDVHLKSKKVQQISLNISGICENCN